MHHYNNQDHSMMTAMLAAKNIQGGNFDCWKVTTRRPNITRRATPRPDDAMPNRFDLKPPRKRRRPRCPHSQAAIGHAEREASMTPYWIAGGVVAAIGLLVIGMKEWPALHGWYTAAKFGARSDRPQTPSEPVASPQTDAMMRELIKSWPRKKKRA